MTPRDELEAAVRRRMSHAVALAVKDTHFGGVDLTKVLNEVTDDILTAAEAYAASVLGEVDGYRRNIPPVVHFLVGGKVPCPARNENVVNTTVRDRVTCGRCRNTRAWKGAAA